MGAGEQFQNVIEYSIKAVTGGVQGLEYIHYLNSYNNHRIIEFSFICVLISIHTYEILIEFIQHGHIHHLLGFENILLDLFFAGQNHLIFINYLDLLLQFTALYSKILFILFLKLYYGGLQVESICYLLLVLNHLLSALLISLTLNLIYIRQIVII